MYNKITEEKMREIVEYALDYANHKSKWVIIPLNQKAVEMMEEALDKAFKEWCTS